MPEAGIFIGGVSFGTYTNGKPNEVSLSYKKIDRLDAASVSAEIFGNPVPQVLVLTETDRLKLTWGDRGTHDFIKCVDVQA